MARQARYDYFGAYHHIMNRGFKGEQLFFDEEDYKYYIDCLERFKNYEYKVLEYCLMPNHIHLLLKTGKIRLQKILKSINTRYALYISKKRGYRGPVFQGRPKSILVTNEEYLKIVSRYILRNPLKAGIVNGLNQYKWNSYSLLTKLKKTPDWLDNTEILKLFSENKFQAIKMYKEFIRKPLKEDDKEYPLELFSGIAAGSKIIYEKILNDLKKDKRKEETRPVSSGEEIIEKILLENNIKFTNLKKKNTEKNIELKRRIAYILKEICHKESREIIEYLEISASTLSNYTRYIYNQIINKKLHIENIHIL